MVLSCTFVLVEVVADTSIFLAVAMNEPEKGSLLKITRGIELVAPEILHYETGNALTAMMNKGRLNAEEMVYVFSQVIQIPVDLRGINIQEALSLAARHNIYAYDAYFLECASRIRRPLLTLDHGMKNIAKKMGITLMENIK